MNTNSPDSSTSPPAVLDMTVIQSLRELGGEDDPSLVFELIDIFLQDAPQRMKDISESLASGDIKRLERAAHTLKSSSANVGAMWLSTICKEMEEIARTNTTQGVASLFAESTRRLGDVEAALRGLRT